MNKQLEEEIEKQAEIYCASKGIDPDKQQSTFIKKDFEAGAKFMFDKLTWKPIERDNLPECIVLCKNNNNDYSCGHIRKTPFNELFCESNDNIMFNCTHYIDLKNF